MRWYMGFFITWIGEFTILYDILEVESKGWLLLSYNQWENGINGVGAEGIPTLRANPPPKSLSALLYMIWMMNQFLLVVVNLNFLIALISQSYEESMNNMIIDQYSTKAEFNNQVYKNMKLLGWGMKNFKTVIVAQEVDNDNATNKNEWNGYAKTVKTYLKKQIDNKVDDLQKIVSTKVGALDAGVGALDTKVGALDAKVGALDAKMDAMMELLSKKQE